MLSKRFWVFSFIDFKLLEYIHQYIESNIMYKQFYGVEELWSSLFIEKFEDLFKNYEDLMNYLQIYVITM
jgi:hypothetical protein